LERKKRRGRKKSASEREREGEEAATRECVCGEMEFLDNELAKIDAVLEPIGSGVGFPIDQFKFILCLLASFPLAIIHKAFSNVVVRHVYAIVVGLFFGWLLYGSTLYHSFLSSTILYLLVRAIPSSPLLPTLAFVFSMGYMTVK